jgi:hypothetical protein
MNRRIVCSLAAATFLFGSWAIGISAQEPPKSKHAQPEGDVFIEFTAPMPFERPVPGQGDQHFIFNREVAGGGPHAGTFSWIASEMTFAGKPVKGAPYSAEAITESTQTLSDGNRIQNRNSANIHRDSEGRTRREQTFGAIGPWAASGDPPQTIIISDPVAKVDYILNPKEKTASKMSPPTFVARGEGGSGTAPALRRQIHIERGDVLVPAAGIAVKEVRRFDADSRQPETEILGKRVIEGLEAEGTRTTLTIPAGQIGNELPIQIVSEKWFSPDLQVVVMSKHSDPRMGETVYRLANINRVEQPRSLFEVPADYSIKEMRPAFRSFPAARTPENKN